MGDYIVDYYKGLLKGILLTCVRQLWGAAVGIPQPPSCSSFSLLAELIVSARWAKSSGGPEPKP